MTKSRRPHFEFDVDQLAADEAAAVHIELVEQSRALAAAYGYDSLAVCDLDDLAGGVRHAFSL